jgi:hypothetical protein
LPEIWQHCDVSPKYRDADGKLVVGATHESVIERIIRDAQERGEFDDLPLHGKPIPLPDNPYAGDMALAFTMLKNAAVAPPWIEADKDARRLIDERDGLLERAARASALGRGTYRKQMERIVAAYNGSVARLNAGAPTTRQHRQPMILADEMRSLERAWSPPGSG